MYNIGDRIVHPIHGAGTIDDITSRVIDGKTLDYYILKLPTGSMTIMVPVATSAEIGIRDVITRELADELISLIPSLEAEDTTNWNKRYRENTARIKTGDLREVVCVIKSLSSRDMKSGLSTGERKMLHTARQILISELSLAKEMSFSEIEELINPLFLQTDR